MGPEGSFDMCGNYFEHPSGPHAESRIIPEMQNCVFEVKYNYVRANGFLHIIGWEKVERCDEGNRFDCKH